MNGILVFWETQCLTQGWSAGNEIGSHWFKLIEALLPDTLLDPEDVGIGHIQSH